MTLRGPRLLRGARDFARCVGRSDPASVPTLARKYHPDVNKDPSAEDRFKEINEAYHVLTDPDTRKRYDRFGDDFRSVPDDRAQRVGAGAHGFRGGGPSGAPVRYGQGFGGTGGMNIEDLFGDMFSGSGGFGPTPGADQEAVLD